MLSWLFSLLLSLGLISGTTASNSEAPAANKGKERGTQVDDQPEGGDDIIISDFIIK